MCARGRQNNQAFKAQVALIEPDADLLRNLTTHSHYIDRRTLDYKIQQTQDRMQYCHIYDSFRHVPMHVRFVKKSHRRMDQVVTSLTLPVEHERVLEAGFFSALNTVKLPMTHIISKVINIRCQARKFSTVTLKLINNKNNPEMPSQMRYLLLCSLLGNYAHCSNTGSFLIQPISRIIFDCTADTLCGI